MFAYGAHDVQHVPRIRDKHHRASRNDHHVHDRCHAVGMEEGQRADRDLPRLRGVGPGACRYGVGHHVAVAEFGALGHARGSTGVDQTGRVLWPQLDRFGRRAGLAQQGLEREIAGVG